jgi:hypothetical protein
MLPNLSKCSLHTTRHQASTHPAVKRYAPSGVPSALRRTPVTPCLPVRHGGTKASIRVRPLIRRSGGDHLVSDSHPVFFLSSYYIPLQSLGRAQLGSLSILFFRLLRTYKNSASLTEAGPVVPPPLLITVTLSGAGRLPAYLQHLFPCLCDAISYYIDPFHNQQSSCPTRYCYRGPRSGRPPRWAGGGRLGHLIL